MDFLGGLITYIPGVSYVIGDSEQDSQHSVETSPVQCDGFLSPGASSPQEGGLAEHHEAKMSRPIGDDTEDGKRQEPPLVNSRIYEDHGSKASDALYDAVGYDKEPEVEPGNSGANSQQADDKTVTNNRSNELDSTDDEVTGGECLELEMKNSGTLSRPEDDQCIESDMSPTDENPGEDRDSANRGDTEHEPEGESEAVEFVTSGMSKDDQADCPRSCHLDARTSSYQHPRNYAPRVDRHGPELKAKLSDRLIRTENGIRSIVDAAEVERDGEDSPQHLHRGNQKFEVHLKRMLQQSEQPCRVDSTPRADSELRQKFREIREKLDPPTGQKSAAVLACSVMSPCSTNVPDDDADASTERSSSLSSEAGTQDDFPKPVAGQKVGICGRRARSRGSRDESIAFFLTSCARRWRLG